MFQHVYIGLEIITINLTLLLLNFFIHVYTRQIFPQLDNQLRNWLSTPNDAVSIVKARLHGCISLRVNLLEQSIYITV